MDLSSKELSHVDMLPKGHSSSDDVDMASHPSDVTHRTTDNEGTIGHEAENENAEGNVETTKKNKSSNQETIEINIEYSSSKQENFDSDEGNIQSLEEKVENNHESTDEKDKLMDSACNGEQGDLVTENKLDAIVKIAQEDKGMTDVEDSALKPVEETNLENEIVSENVAQEISVQPQGDESRTDVQEDSALKPAEETYLENEIVAEEKSVEPQSLSSGKSDIVMSEAPEVDAEEGKSSKQESPTDSEESSTTDDKLTKELCDIDEKNIGKAKKAAVVVISSTSSSDDEVVISLTSSSDDEDDSSSSSDSDEESSGDDSSSGTSYSSAEEEGDSDSSSSSSDSDSEDSTEEDGTEDDKDVLEEQKNAYVVEVVKRSNVETKENAVEMKEQDSPFEDVQKAKAKELKKNHGNEEELCYSVDTSGKYIEVEVTTQYEGVKKESPVCVIESCMSLKSDELDLMIKDQADKVSGDRPEQTTIQKTPTKYGAHTSAPVQVFKTPTKLEPSPSKFLVPVSPVPRLRMTPDKYKSPLKNFKALLSPRKLEATNYSPRTIARMKLTGQWEDSWDGSENVERSNSPVEVVECVLQGKKLVATPKKKRSLEGVSNHGTGDGEVEEIMMDQPGRLKILKLDQAELKSEAEDHNVNILLKRPLPDESSEEKSSECSDVSDELVLSLAVSDENQEKEGMLVTDMFGVIVISSSDNDEICLDDGENSNKETEEKDSAEEVKITKIRTYQEKSQEKESSDEEEEKEEGEVDEEIEENFEISDIFNFGDSMSSLLGTSCGSDSLDRKLRRSSSRNLKNIQKKTSTDSGKAEHSEEGEVSSSEDEAHKLKEGSTKDSVNNEKGKISNPMKTDSTRDKLKRNKDGRGKNDTPKIIDNARDSVNNSKGEHEKPIVGWKRMKDKPRRIENKTRTNMKSEQQKKQPLKSRHSSDQDQDRNCGNRGPSDRGQERSPRVRAQTELASGGTRGRDMHRAEGSRSKLQSRENDEKEDRLDSRNSRALKRTDSRYSLRSGNCQEVSQKQMSRHIKSKRERSESVTTRESVYKRNRNH